MQRSNRLQRALNILLLGPLLPGVINACIIQLFCVHYNYAKPYAYMLDNASIPCWRSGEHTARVRLAQVVLVALLALATYRSSKLEVETVMFRPSMAYALLRFLAFFSCSFTSCALAEHLHVQSHRLYAVEFESSYGPALDQHRTVNFAAVLCLLLWHCAFDADRGFAAWRTRRAPARSALPLGSRR